MNAEQAIKVVIGRQATDEQVLMVARKLVAGAGWPEPRLAEVISAAEAVGFTSHV